MDLTPGTLAALGEEALPATPVQASQHLANVTDEELLAELGYRLTRLKRELTEATKDQADEKITEATKDQADEKITEATKDQADEKITELGDRRNASVPAHSRRLAADSGHPKMDDQEHE